MVIVMDMSTGQRDEAYEEFGQYQDEVLGANWTPQPELGLQQHSAVPARRRRIEPPPPDIEGYLRTIYLAQE